MTDKLFTLGEAMRPKLPALLTLLDVPVDDVTWRALASTQRRQQMLDAVRQMLLREAQEAACGNKR